MGDVKLNTLELLMKLFMTQRVSGLDTILQQLKMRNGGVYVERLMSFAEASPAKLFHLQGIDEDLKMLEDQCFLRLQERPGKSNHAIWHLKMFEGYYHTTRGGRSELSSLHWMSWGMTRNGYCVTAKITESHRTGSGYTLADILENEVDDKFYLSGDQVERLVNQMDNECMIDFGMIDDQGRKNKKLKMKNICPTLRAEFHGNVPKIISFVTNEVEGVKKILPVSTPDRVKRRQNGRRFKQNNESMFTLTTKDIHGVAILKLVRTGYGKQIRKLYEKGVMAEKRGNMTKLELRAGGLSNTITTVQKEGNNKDVLHGTSALGSGICHKNNELLLYVAIRKLTPRECWRLQSFPDWAFDRAQSVNSDSQLYKQAGNAVTVNIVYEIAKKLGERSE